MALQFRHPFDQNSVCSPHNPQRAGAGNYPSGSPSGGKIEVFCDRVDNSIQLSVLDHAQGISQQDCQKLFQKFNQLKAGKQAGGSGLGLAMCKLIVQEHGGADGVDSVPGQGARFWFTLPRHDDDDN